MELSCKNKILLIADYGRSGQGWLSYMLSYILNATYIEPYNFLVGTRYTKSDYIFNLTQGNLSDREKTGYSLVVKTHNYPAENFNLPDKVIFLTRDPRDVAVSMHNLHLIHERAVKWNHPRAKIILLFKRYFKIIDYIKTISEWFSYYNGYQKIDHYRVRYEDLLNNTASELGKITTFLGEEANKKIIEDAVGNFSFEKITGRIPGQEDKNNAEFRKGIAGDYKNKMSTLEIFIINNIFKNIIRKSGYEANG